MAKIYPFVPNPQIIPVTTPLIRDLWRNSSLLYMFDIWSSIILPLNTSKASRIATDVWVYPPALIIIPSKFFLEFCIISTISPSTLDCLTSTVKFNSSDFFLVLLFINTIVLLLFIICHTNTIVFTRFLEYSREYNAVLYYYRLVLLPVYGRSY